MGLPPGGNEQLAVVVAVDQRTFTKTLTFNRPISALEASQYLVGDGILAPALKQVTGQSGPSTTYQLETSDMGVLMRLRPEVRDAIIQGGVIRTTAKPLGFAPWVPVNVKNDIIAGKTRQGVSRYPQPGEWGDVVVWRQNDVVEIYQEFPSDIKFYERVALDEATGRLLHFAYTQFNSDMRHFVDGRGMSPELARSEIRRINDEVFKLVLEGAAMMLTSGGALAQVQAAMAASSRQIAAAARRSPRLIQQTPAQAKVKPVGGSVNVGGGFETPNITNLNPVKAHTGGPTSGIPNHVNGSMEQMADLFEPGSVKSLISSRLRYVDVDWEAATKAAYTVMEPGGQVNMNVWCEPAQIQALVAAFERAGFKNVSTWGDGVATMLTAIR